MELIFAGEPPALPDGFTKQVLIFQEIFNQSSVANDCFQTYIVIYAAFFIPTILFAATQITIVISMSGRVFPRMKSTFIK